jgi:hypothetical protein
MIQLIAWCCSAVEPKSDLVNQLQIETDSSNSFDLDEVTEADLEDVPLEPLLYDMNSLNLLLNRPELLPPEIEVELMQPKEYRYSIAGMSYPLRVTTDPEYYDLHSSSTEFWSPGNLLFPDVSEIDSNQVLTDLNVLLSL